MKEHERILNRKEYFLNFLSFVSLPRRIFTVGGNAKKTVKVFANIVTFMHGTWFSFHQYYKHHLVFGAYFSISIEYFHVIRLSIHQIYVSI